MQPSEQALIDLVSGCLLLVVAELINSGLISKEEVEGKLAAVLALLKHPSRPLIARALDPDAGSILDASYDAAYARALASFERILLLSAPPG